MSETKVPNSRGDGVVLMRAQNGELIRAEDSGLVMKLADQVVDDLRERLEIPAPNSENATNLDAELLGDIDAWGLRIQDEWYIFDARMPQTKFPRGYRRLLDGGEIFADAPGSLFGILSIGGARRGLGFDTVQSYPYHVLTPADGAGAPGWAGTQTEGTHVAMQRLGEQTRSALTAEALLSGREDAGRALPLFYVREQTDSSAGIQQLADGQAFHNLIATAKSLKLAAQSLGKRARILAVGIDFCLEDTTSSPVSYRDGFLSLMTKITSQIAEIGFRKPIYLSVFECGTRRCQKQDILLAQCELAWNSSGHDLVFTAPGYMFEQDEFGRPTETSLQEMAAMDAAALFAIESGETWACPIFLLAEREGDVIRVVAESLSPLVLDVTDPLKTGKHFGFSLAGADEGVEITSIEICEKSERDILVKCNKSPTGVNLRLLYAFGATNDGDKYPANRGGVRDEWCEMATTGRALHRWALPCDLPVH